ncbi:unnamed protein product [Rotaria sp. Silwood1]|nr:unnamed protein product [Rotaria sp. Silwood1]CAF5071665.1 unnamed protein product [Rotaria sp. Silwood1]
MSSLPPPTNPYKIIEFYFIRYFCTVLLILGTFGNTLNICIFTRSKLRSVSCSWYFLAATCENFIALYVGCLTRLLSTFDVNPRTTLSASIYCKFRSYFTYGNLSASMWLIIGACMDRWASSSSNVRIRSIGEIKIAKRIILSIICIMHLIYDPMLYCYDGVYELPSSNCVTISTTWQLFISSFFFLHILFFHVV